MRVEWLLDAPGGRVETRGETGRCAGWGGVQEGAQTAQLICRYHCIIWLLLFVCLLFGSGVEDEIEFTTCRVFGGFLDVWNCELCLGRQPHDNALHYVNQQWSRVIVTLRILRRTTVFIKPN